MTILRTSEEDAVFAPPCFVLLLPLFAVAGKSYAALDGMICEHLVALSEWERSDGTSIDRPAEIFGKLMSDILSYGLEGTSERIAAEIGFHIGKWVYLADAADDYDEDVKKGRYNPLIRAYGDTFGQAERQSLLTAMTAELCAAERGFDLLNYPDADMEGVIKNIIYLGMPHMAETIVGDRKGGGNERSV